MENEISEQTTTKQDIIIVIIVKDTHKESINECLEGLKKECAQHHVERCTSFDQAFDYINQLDPNMTVILIVTEGSHENHKVDLSQVGSFPRAVRNCFIFSSKNKDMENSNTSLIHHIYGKRQLLSAVRDVLDALDVPPIHGHSDQYLSVTVHESTFNQLFKAMKSIQVKPLGFTIKISQMEAALSPSIFQFKAFAEVLGVLSAIPHLKQTVHGECDLTLDETTGRLMLNIRKLMIQLPKLFGFGGGFTDIGNYIPPIPLKGLINLTHPIDLPHTCETRHILVIPRNQKFIVEEKRATYSVQIDFQEASSNE